MYQCQRKAGYSKARTGTSAGVNTEEEADILAGDLKALNDSRKDMTEEAVKLATSRWRTAI